MFNKLGSVTTSEVTSMATSLVKADHKELTAHIHHDLDLQNISETILQCEETIKANSADIKIKTRLSIAKILLTWPSGKLDLEELKKVQADFSQIFHLAAVLKATKQFLLRYDILKVIKQLWVDMSMTP